MTPSRDIGLMTKSLEMSFYIPRSNKDLKDLPLL